MSLIQNHIESAFIVDKKSDLIHFREIHAPVEPHFVFGRSWQCLSTVHCPPTVRVIWIGS
jgi:hypothetical protein